MQSAVQEVDVGLEVVGHAALTDAFGDGTAFALGQLAAGGDVGVKHRSRWVGEPALHAAVGGFLKVSGYAGNGTCCSGGAGESVKLAIGLGPDFRTGSLDMRLAVGSVVELVCPDGVVEGGGVAGGLVVVVLRVLEGYRWHRTDVCAQQAKEVNFALRLGVGHVDDEVVAFGAADVGKADACVASSAFDYGAAGLEQATLLGILDDVKGGAVFD